MTGPGTIHQEAPLIALTGATGFLGSHIADILLARGYRVRASVRSTSNLRWLIEKPLETPTVDLTDPRDCRRFADGSSGLIHCAGAVTAPNEDAYNLANVTSTACLLEAAQEAWAPLADPAGFILISSLAAHGPASLDNPAVESNPCRPITAYGRSKVAAEELVARDRWSFRRAVLRPPGLYGPRDAEFLPLFRLALRGVTAHVGRRMTGLSLVDGRDAAEAAVTLLENRQTSGAYFVDDGRAGYDWSAMAAALSEAAGRRVRTLTVPLGLLKMASVLAGSRRAGQSPVLNRDRIADLDTVGWVCDGSRLTTDTGFKATRDASRGFAETLRFYREEHWL